MGHENNHPSKAELRRLQTSTIMCTNDANTTLNALHVCDDDDTAITLTLAYGPFMN